MSKETSRPIELTCPCCGNRLTVDRSTGAILLEDRPRQMAHKSLDEAAQEAAAKKEQAKAQLQKAMEEAQHRDEIFDKKFREAVKKADKSDKPPPRPFDQD